MVSEAFENGNNIVFMKNHGIIVGSESMKKAFYICETIENYFTILITAYEIKHLLNVQILNPPDLIDVKSDFPISKSTSLINEIIIELNKSANQSIEINEIILKNKINFLCKICKRCYNRVYLYYIRDIFGVIIYAVL